MTQSRIIVGMSGGVDSSLAAALLIEQGYEVEGLFMNNWDDDDAYCTAAEDYQDARRVADELGIPLHKASFAAEYRERVFQYFLEEYRAGRTPNPDVLCNREIKFKAFLDYATRLGADKIATGHYARIGERDGQLCLLKGVDDNKDQTYFLHTVSRGALARSLFPVGHLPKPEVRRMAEDLGLHNHARKDSTGICFIGERDFQEFLAKYLPAQPGDIVTRDGEVIGRHDGLMYYTIGQRKGLGIGGQQNNPLEAPWYVADKDMDGNRLIAVQGSEHPALFKPGLTVVDLHWINAPPTLPHTCTARIRHRQRVQDCEIQGTHGEQLTVRFAQPQRAVTPGQWIVFYDDDICLGGGIIAA